MAQLTDTAIGLTLMTGRGRLYKALAERAGITDGTTGVTLVDVGCGPGSAARVAAKRGATVIAVDPSPAMRRLGRVFTPDDYDVRYVDGSAERLPVPDAGAQVVWAIGSAHHWSDVPAGLRECRRVLGPGGRLLVVEASVGEHAHGLAAHGFSHTRTDDVVAQCHELAFSRVNVEPLQSGRRRFTLIDATCDS
jgi:ubiquinone/menaquinone biosynthesis C-methylase UbiE